ncbi:MAG: prfA, partial [Burkholderiales bacterium]|nr:prfA [Burkholderiales bacterium]
MNPRLRAKLDGMVGRLGDLNGMLAAENATRDMEQFKKLSREHSELTSLTSLYEAYRQAERDAAEASELAADAAMRSYADEELKKARAAMEKLEADLQR